MVYFMTVTLCTQIQGSFVLVLNCPHAIGQKKKWANEKAVIYTVLWVYWCHHPLFYVHPTGPRT